ncbi:MAG: rhodanese-like domain-containing protein [Actinomycetota bacterium]|nr:rhodanese-like domain-containing protein [Actinomycetota bacterium]
MLPDRHRAALRVARDEWQAADTAELVDVVGALEAGETPTVDTLGGRVRESLARVSALEAGRSVVDQAVRYFMARVRVGVYRDHRDEVVKWCAAARWTPHHSGIDCAILRGGLERWQAEGHAVAAGSAPTTSVPPPVVIDGRPTGRATKQDVLDAIGDGNACLIDALPASSFDGTDPGYGPRSGHIIGAENVPFRSLIDDETAGFPDADELHRRLSAAGLFDRGPVITYCGGAIAATVPAFALALFDKTDVRVYDGSLMEWSADDTLPMSGG